MAQADEQPAAPTFATALRDALAATGISQKELSRRLARTTTTTRESEAKRSQILKWLSGRHEPELASAREVEEALGLPAGQLQGLVNRKPRGRPAALRRDQEIAGLRAELEEMRATREATAQRLGARLLEVEAQAAEREREAQDLAQLIAGLVVRVERLEGGASRKRGSP